MEFNYTDNVFTCTYKVNSDEVKEFLLELEKQASLFDEDTQIIMRQGDKEIVYKSSAKGEWIDAEIETETIDGVKTKILACECSECGHFNPWDSAWRYCPWCGAEMEKE